MEIYKSRYSGVEIDNSIEKSSNLPQNVGNQFNILRSNGITFESKPFPLIHHGVLIETTNFNIQFDIYDDSNEYYNIDDFPKNLFKYIPILQAGGITLFNCYIGVGVGTNNKALNIMYANSATSASTLHTYVSILNITDVHIEV